MYFLPKMQKPNNPIENYFHDITKYHYLFFFIVFSSKIPLTWHILSLIFLSPPMDFTCNSSLDVNYSLNVCPCEDPVWNRSIFTETFQTEFDTHCEKDWLVSFSQSMFYFGVLIGSFLFGFLSDKFGRLTMYALSCLIIAFFGCLVCIMPTVETYILIRCVEGIGVGGCIVSAYVLCIEYTSTRYREIITSLFHIPINIGHVSLAGLSYLLRHSDHLQITISVPIFLYALTPFILLESPKWLMDVGNVDKAAEDIEKFCKFNKQEFGDVKQELEDYRSTCPPHHRQLNFWNLFMKRKLAINVLCMSVIYFVCGMGYYGVSQFIGKMSGDIHVNVAISGTLLLPGTLASIYLLKLFSRRFFLMATNFLSGLFMIIVVCVPEEHNLIRVFCACLGNTFFFMSFLTVFLFSVELFPTSVRSSVLGFLSVLSRVGQIVAPIVNSLDEIAAGVSFGVLAIFGSLLCSPLPETKDTDLPSWYDHSKEPKLSARSNGTSENEVGTSIKINE